MTTPEHSSTPTTPEYSTEERNVLSMKQLEDWRKFQEADLDDRRGRSGYIPSLGGKVAIDEEPPYVTEFKAGVDTSLDSYLDSLHLPVDSPNRDVIKGLFRDASIDKISVDDWRGSPASRGGDPADTKSPRTVFSEKINEYLGVGVDGDDETSPADDETEGPEAREERLAEARAAVAEAREKWASISSKRQARVFRRNAKDQATAYHDYMTKVNELGRLELEDIISDDTVDETKKNAEVISYLFDEQAKLRELTTEKLKGTKVSKFIAWMNKGGLVKRILKGGSIGLAAGLVGAFAGGLVGAGVVTAGAVGAARFVRGYTLGDKDKRGMAAADESMKDDVATRLADTDIDGDTFDKASLHFDAAFENDTRKEQNKRRKAAAAGLGMVAVGSLAGYGVHAAAAAISHHDLQWLGGNHHHGTGKNTTTGKGTGSGAGTGDANAGQGGHPGGAGHDGYPGDKSGGIDNAPKLPSVNGEYPWNRMETALQKGIITPPKGMTAEQALHHYGQLLAQNGDHVQWDPLSGGREYLVVNGHDDTGYVWDRILSAAQKAGDVVNR